MILISNHLLQIEQFRKLRDVIIRINLAHVRDKEEFNNFLLNDKEIMIDYPKGRKKPPLPTLDISEIIDIIQDKENVKYFAISNVESPSDILDLKEKLPERIEIVPKIETVKGVINLKEIIQIGKVKHIMLDSEDLYTDTNNNNIFYNSLKSDVVKICNEYNAGLLELHGVVFKKG